MHRGKRLLIAVGAVVEILGAVSVIMLAVVGAYIILSAVQP